MSMRAERNRGAATSLVDQRTATTIAIRGQQPARLPRAQPQNRRGRNLTRVFLTKTAKSQFWGRNWKLV